MRRAQRHASRKRDHQQQHGAEDQQDRPQAIFPERCAELHAISAAQNVADRFNEARRGPQPDDRAKPPVIPADLRDQTQRVWQGG